MIKFISKNKFLCFLGVAVIGAGVALMMVSQQVYTTERNVKNMNREALKAEWDIRALKAELAYLSRPDRLDQISSALTQSGANGDAVNYFPIATISLDMPAQSKTPAIIPIKKPHFVTYQNPVAQKQDFSTLLQTIGGDE